MVLKLVLSYFLVIIFCRGLWGCVKNISFGGWAKGVDFHPFFPSITPDDSQRSLSFEKKISHDSSSVISFTTQLRILIDFFKIMLVICLKLKCRSLLFLSLLFVHSAQICAVCFFWQKWIIWNIAMRGRHLWHFENNWKYFHSIPINIITIRRSLLKWRCKPVLCPATRTLNSKSRRIDSD